MSAWRCIVAYIAVLSLALTGGCGQKGALVLPDEAMATVPAPTPPAADAPAPTADDSDQPTTRRSR